MKTRKIVAKVNISPKLHEIDLDTPSQDVDVDWFVVRVTPMHLGLMLQALCSPLLVSSVNSRGAPRHTGVRDLC
jgi:hypothetical protein